MAELTDADLELAFYEQFFFERELEPYPVQEEAFGHIFAGRDILVTVPTGTGKTMMAKAGIYRALKSGRTAIYTTPLRALTEEKFRELCEDFGEENVGFATGDYQVNAAAPIQVQVAEILWNRVYDNPLTAPADIVIMDEGHYFNEPQRGYVWEQSIIGLHPETQLVILSATIGAPQSFCQWVYITRRAPMTLVRSDERKVPLLHEYREEYLVECVKRLWANGEYPAIIFGFSRAQCFERARLLKSCPRFVSDEEREEIEARIEHVLFEEGLGKEIRPLLLHGIGIHHAGILPRYKQLIEELTKERLLKFVVSTETIAAGINLPAKRVVFPSLRKYIKRKARLLRPDEYHQMSGRAGRPQFDTEGVAITLAPEEVVQELRREIKQAKKRGHSVDEAKIKKRLYARAKVDASKKSDVSWDDEAHKKLVEGEPAQLSSKTRVTAEQILAIGLPDLTREHLSGERILSEAEAEQEAQDKLLLESLPAYANLHIGTVIDNLLLPDREKREAQKHLAMVTKNLQALGVLDEHGQQVKGEIIGKIRGLDGPFVYYAVVNHDFTYEEARELVELLVDHEVIWRALMKQEWEKRKAKIRELLFEMRQDSPQVSWEDAEAEYEKKHPPVLSRAEEVHQEFTALLPHPELHGGKTQKAVWALMEDGDKAFFDFVIDNGLEREEGSLFSYLSRTMKAAKMIAEVTDIDHYAEIEGRIRAVLGRVDERVLSGKMG